MSKTSIPFIDLFSGAGGLSAGFEQAGFHSVFANDNDQFACETYQLNHPNAFVSQADVETVTAQAILDITGLTSIPLVIGGPNCQGVSLRGKRDPNDPKNKMFFHFKRIIDELRPDWFVMENVPGLLHRHNRSLITEIFEQFESIGYTCGAEVLLAADYGVPQLRYRFVLIGNRFGAPVLFPNPTHQCSLERQPSLFPEEDGRPLWLTVRDAIGDLPAIPNGGGSDCIPYGESMPSVLSAYAKYCRQESDMLYNHVCHKIPDHNLKLIQYIPQGKNWKSIPENLRPDRFKRVALKDHTTTFGRLHWDMPARTITTYFNNISAGAFTHPVQQRGISVREGARFQSFPDTFRFIGPLSRQHRQIGNAVPPLMAFHVAKLLHGLIINSEGNDENTHTAAVVFDTRFNDIQVNRPLQGMRFNLDEHLVRS